MADQKDQKSSYTMFATLGNGGYGKVFGLKPSDKKNIDAFEELRRVEAAKRSSFPKDEKTGESIISEFTPETTTSLKEKREILETAFATQPIARKYAIKKEDSDTFLRHELAQMEDARLLRHSKAIKKDRKGFYLDMEFISGKQLSGYSVSHLTFAEKTQLILQLVEQVHNLHRNRKGEIIHGDIKLENILIDAEKRDATNTNPKRNIVLIDLGVSTTTSTIDELNPHKINMRGNPQYCPPETIQTARQDPRYGTGSDIYMLAAPLLSLLGATDPYGKKFGELNPLRQLYDADGALIPDMQLDNNVDLRLVTLEFIKQMQNFQYIDRPKDDTVLKFFILLNKLAICAAQQKQHQKNSEKWRALQSDKNTFALELHNYVFKDSPKFVEKYKIQKRILYTLGVLAVCSAIPISYAFAPKRTVNFFEKEVNILGTEIPMYAIFIIGAGLGLLVAAGIAGRYFYNKSKDEEKEIAGPKSSPIPDEKASPKKEEQPEATEVREADFASTPAVEHEEAPTTFSAGLA